MKETKASEDRRKAKTGASVSKTIRDVFARCRTIAVYGISRDPEAASYRVASYLAEKGYHILPINPHADRIDGRKVYPRLEDVPEEIDVLDVFRPSDQVPSVVREAVERRRRRGDIPVVWLQLDIKSEDARSLAEKAGMTFVQDRCMMVEHRRLHPLKGLAQA